MIATRDMATAYIHEGYFLCKLKFPIICF